MQQAARTVALENARLRAMLAKMGAGEADVDSYLQTCLDHEAAEALSSVSRPQITEAANMQDETDDENSSPSILPARGVKHEADLAATNFARAGSHNYHTSLSTSVGGHAGQSAFDKLDVLASATLHQSCCEGKTRCTASAPLPTPLPTPTGSSTSTLTWAPQSHPSHEVASPATIEPSTGAVTPSSSYAPALSPSVQDMSSPMEMSCNAAAQIIAEMQGHGDRESAKNRLGCHGKNECLVKNAALFHILESEAQYS